MDLRWDIDAADVPMWQGGLLKLPTVFREFMPEGDVDSIYRLTEVFELAVSEST